MLAATTPKPATPNPQYPAHIAIIMDGNGRWAKQRHAPRIHGHQKGAETLRETLNACSELGIQWLTVYAFSSENWNRPKQEVEDLMGLLKLYIKKELKTLKANDIRLSFIGDRSRFSADVRQILQKAEEATKTNQKFHLNIALSYGSKQEITLACKSIAEDIESGKLTAQQVNEALLSEKLYTSHMPEPDLLIRTGGEQRLSNFLLWQMAYTELYFTDTLWPDFSKDDLQKAIDAYSTRERRYGTTNE